jgi:FHS family L-fucose permease-like MFS transporter
MLRDVRISFPRLTLPRAQLTCSCSGIIIDQTRKEFFRFRNIDELKERREKKEELVKEREIQETDDVSKDRSGSEEIEKV